jgi:hypothetical protein
MWWSAYTTEEAVAIRMVEGDRYFDQEYAGSFLTSGRSVFDSKLIKKLYEGVLNVGDKNGEHIVYEVDKLRVYKEHEEKVTYCIAGDVSEGVEGGDYSVATVWNRETGEEVAMWRGLIPPDRFGVKLDEIGRKYNNALMVVESNNHGLTTITKLKEMLYPTLYFRPQKIETMSQSFSEKLGWKTNKATRPLMIDELNQALREEALTPHSKELIDEMVVFVYDDAGNMGHQPGFNDDCIFSAAMAMQGFKILYSGELQQNDHRDYLPKSFSY